MLKRLLVLVTLFLLVFVTDVRADEFVVDGGFDNAFTYWPLSGGSGTIQMGGDCDAGEVMFSASEGETYVAQCINIVTDGSEWSMDFDAIMPSGDGLYCKVGVRFLFYSLADCSGDVKYTAISMTSLPFDWDYAATLMFDTAGNAESILVTGLVEVSDSGHPMTGCLDNVTLSAPGATLVSAHSLEAQGFNRAYAALGLGVVGVFLGSMKRHKD